MAGPTHHHDSSSDHVVHAEGRRADHSQTQSNKHIKGHDLTQRSSHSGTQPVIQSPSLLGAQFAGRVPYHSRAQKHRHYRPESGYNDQAHKAVQQSQQEFKQAQQSPVQTALSFAEWLARLSEATGKL
jgi:hypothetical protein